MKKYSLIALLNIILFYFACEKDAPIEILLSDPSIKIHHLPDAIERLDEKTTQIMVKVNDPQGIQNIDEVNIEIKQNGSLVDAGLMWDDGLNGDIIANNGTFTYSIIPKNPPFSLGKVFLTFHAKDIDGNLSSDLFDTLEVKEVLVNEPPQILNLVMLNEIARNVSFVFSVQAIDPNGLADISIVFFKLYRPDGTQSTPGGNLDFFTMVDNGDKDGFGDEVANDGIFSFKNSFSSTSQLGTWRFEIQAQDKAGNKSNLITHNLLVVQ